jgi:hypothetical protein
MSVPWVRGLHDHAAPTLVVPTLAVYGGVHLGNCVPSLGDVQAPTSPDGSQPRSVVGKDSRVVHHPTYLDRRPMRGHVLSPHGGRWQA